MKLRLLLTALLFVPVLHAAEQKPIGKVKFEDKEYSVYAFPKDAEPTSVTNPIYPARAKDEKRGGDTLVAAIIDEKGKVTLTRVAKSSGAEDIQQAARDAVAKWRFPKLTDGGKPISYVVFVPIVLEP